MAGGSGQATLEELWDHSKPNGVSWGGHEVIGQMFVDDSIWSSKSGHGMQKMVLLHEEFCDCNGLQLNRDKCAYFAVNAPAAELRWKGHAEDTKGRGQLLSDFKVGGKQYNIVQGGELQLQSRIHGR